MTQEQYKEKLSFLEKVFRDAKLNVQKEYAISNNTIKVSDILTDHIGSIKVEKIGVYIGLNPFPECAYTGTVINKKGELDKKGTKRSIYQSNLKLSNI
jgi:hypothetical protein